MQKSDLALQLTLKALDRHPSLFRKDEEEMVGENIATLFNTIYKNINLPNQD